MTKSKPLTVKKWILTGELNQCKKQESILEQCGRLLDKNGVYDILGDVLFQATNGKYYTVTVEAVIAQANPEFVKEVLAEKAAGW
jgi:hypothetical protein